jgi:hypothetical protein
MKDTPKKKREFGVILESIDSNVKHVVEAVDTHTKQLGRLEKRVENLESMKDDVAAIKVTLGIMKNDLKQKVDREEFVALEERVNRLEAKAR